MNESGMPMPFEPRIGDKTTYVDKDGETKTGTVTAITGANHSLDISDEQGRFLCMGLRGKDGQYYFAFGDEPMSFQGPDPDTIGKAQRLDDLRRWMSFRRGWAFRRGDLEKAGSHEVTLFFIETGKTPLDNVENDGGFHEWRQRYVDPDDRSKSIVNLDAEGIIIADQIPEHAARSVLWSHAHEAAYAECGRALREGDYKAWAIGTRILFLLLNGTLAEANVAEYAEFIQELAHEIGGEGVQLPTEPPAQ